MHTLRTYAMILGVAVLLHLPCFMYSQILPVDTVYNKKKTTLTLTTVGVGYVGSMTWLGSQWYANYPRSSFHLFNDQTEWLQMDKVGHFGTANFIGRIGYDMLRWSGIEKNKALWWGGGSGFIYLTTVEILDGFSKEWGFSWGDMACNALGSGLFIAQESIWDEERALIKYSFWPTEYAEYRPDLFGKAMINQMLKDYNGQTYWLSINPYSFLSADSKFPKWLNVAIGYSAEGMLGASSNPSQHNGMILPDYNRYRQYYLSLDIDLSRIPVKNKFLKATFELFNVIKIPAPALEYSNQGFHFHPIYF